MEEALLRDPRLMAKGAADVCRAAGLDPQIYRGNVHRYLVRLRAALPANLETLAQTAALAQETGGANPSHPVTTGEIAILQREVLREIRTRKLERAELPALLELAKFLHTLAPMGTEATAEGAPQKATSEEQAERKNPLVMLHERRRAASG